MKTFMVLQRVRRAASLVLADRPLASCGSRASCCGSRPAATRPIRPTGSQRWTAAPSRPAFGPPERSTPLTTVLVGSQLSGQVVEILADYNTPVKAGPGRGTAIYAEQIKSRRDAALADLAQAKADRDTKRAQIDKARARLAARRSAGRRSCGAARPRAGAARRGAAQPRTADGTARARGRNAERARSGRSTQVDIQKAALASADAQIASNKAETAGLKADIALAEAGLKSGRGGHPAARRRSCGTSRSISPARTSNRPSMASW